jgi:hypothetical protein
MTEQINPLYVCTLWYKPRKTMQGLIENGRGHRTALIVAIASGMIQALPVYSSDESMGVSVFLIGASHWLLRALPLRMVTAQFWALVWSAGQLARSAHWTGARPHALVALFFQYFSSSDKIFGSSAVGQYFWLFFIPLVYGYIVVILSLTAAPSTDAFEDFSFA